MVTDSQRNIYEGAVGKRRLNRDEGTDGVFAILSTTKAITGTAALQLVVAARPQRRSPRSPAVCRSRERRSWRAHLGCRDGGQYGSRRRAHHGASPARLRTRPPGAMKVSAAAGHYLRCHGKRRDLMLQASLSCLGSMSKTTRLKQAHGSALRFEGHAIHAQLISCMRLMPSIWARPAR